VNFDFPAFYQLVPAELIAARVANLARACRQNGLVAMVLTSATDIYYATGSMQQGVAVVDAEGGALFLARRHSGRAAAESRAPVVAVSGLGQVAAHLLETLPAKARLGFCLDLLSARDLLGWQMRLPGVEIVDVAPALLRVKGVKDAFEREMMVKSGALAAEVYELLPGWLAPGVSEIAVASQMVGAAIARGHVDILRTRGSFMEPYSWHLVSGPEGAAPGAIDAAFAGYGLSPAFPQGASAKPLKPHEPILVDFTVCLAGYQTDQTRTYCLGSAPDQVHRAHEALVAVENALLEGLRPGAVSGELFDLAVEVAASHGMAEVFLGRADQRTKFVAHGLGLELGAPPYLLKGGQERVRAHEAYALELKIVLDDGPVGLENTVIVNPQGPPTLTCPIPSRLIELPL